MSESVCKSLWEVQGPSGNCISLVREVPWIPVLLIFNAIFVFVTNGVTFFVSLNRILGIWMQYWYKKSHGSACQFPVRDLRFWSLIAKCIKAILMSLAQLDMWGFLSTWSVTTYLGLYTTPYGLATLSTILLQFNFVDRIFLQQISGRLTIRKSYSILTMIGMGLATAYSLGYIAFGWKLLDAFKKNPDTTLGVTGNILVITSYAILIVNVLVCMVPSIYIMLETGLFGITKSEELTRVTNNMISWSLQVTVIAILNLVNLCMFSYTKVPKTILTDGELTEVLVRAFLPTVFVLFFNRVAEAALDYSDLNLMGSESVEMIPGENFVMFFIGDRMGRYTSTKSSNTRTMSNLSISRSRRGTSGGNESGGDSSV